MLNLDETITKLQNWAANEPLILCLIIFGSYAKGTADERSDLDIAVINDYERGDMDRHVAFIYNKNRWLGELQSLLGFSMIHLEWYDYEFSNTECVKSGLNEASILIYADSSLECNVLTKIDKSKWRNVI